MGLLKVLIVMECCVISAGCSQSATLFHWRVWVHTLHGLVHSTGWYIPRVGTFHGFVVHSMGWYIPWVCGTFSSVCWLIQLMYVCMSVQGCHDRDVYLV